LATPTAGPIAVHDVASQYNEEENKRDPKEFVPSLRNVIQAKKN
jgi:hypothetical protein